MSETSSPREVDMYIVEVALVRQASPNLALFRLGVNNFLMRAPLRIILQERLFEIDLKIKVIVIRNPDTFQLGMRSIVLRLNCCLDEYRLHFALLREVSHDSFLEIPHLILHLFVNFYAASKVLLRNQNHMSLGFFLQRMKGRNFLWES